MCAVNIQALEMERVQLEKELDWQMGHKRIAQIQDRLSEIEEEIAKANIEVSDTNHQRLY